MGWLCGVSQAFGVWWFYAALGAGPISVVSPRTATWSRDPVGVSLALGERPGAIAAVVVLALAAVVLVSRGPLRTSLAQVHHKGRLVDGGLGRAFGLNSC